MSKKIPIKNVGENIYKILKEVGRHDDRVIVTEDGEPKSVIMSYKEFKLFGEYLDMDDVEERFCEILKETEKMFAAHKDIKHRVKKMAGTGEEQDSINVVMEEITDKLLENREDRISDESINKEDMEKVIERLELEREKEALKEGLYQMFIRQVEQERTGSGYNLH